MESDRVCVIGMCGKRGHGKDTVADYFVCEHGFTKIAFATPLKEATRIIFGLDDAQLNGPLKEVPDKRWGVSARELLQVIGTDCFRDALSAKIPAIGRDLWVRVMDYRIQDLIADGVRKIVVSDVRYPNEADIVHKFGGQVIRVERPALIATDKFAAHSSETSIDQIVADYEIKTDALHEKLARAEVTIRDILRS